MIASFRAFAKSWFATLLIGLLIVSFAVFGVQDVFRGRISNSVVTAGSRTVTPQQFKREFDSYRKGLEQQVGQPVTQEIAIENHLDARLLEELANQEGFAALLGKIGLKPADSLMKAQLEKIPAFFDQVSGRFDKTLYLQKLGENQFTAPEFEQRMRDDIAQNHFASGMVNGMRVPRAYTALGAVMDMETRDVGFFAVDPRSVAQPALPTDAQLTQFMKDNAAQLMRPEFRVLTVVKFSPSMVSQNLPIDEAELKKRFDYRKDTLSQPETRTVAQIPVKDAKTGQAVAQRLSSGENPSLVAKSVGAEAIIYADKPRTAIADSKVGAAAFSLPRGGVSVVQGDLGTAVVIVGAITPGHTVTLEEVRPALEAELRKDAAAQKVYDISQAYDDAHAGGASLAEAAKKAGAPTITLGPVTEQGQGLNGQPVPGVTPQMLKTAFALAAGTDSEIEDAGQGEYFAVRVEKVIGKALPPLAEVKPQLVRVWMLREMTKRLQAKADELAARVKKGESLEAVAGSVGQRVVRVTGLDRQNAAQNQTLSRDALGKAFNLPKGDVFTAENGQAFGLVVAKLEGVHAPSGSTLARATEDMRPQVTMALFRELGADARRYARTELKVKVNTDQARAALGLEPEDTKGKGDKAKTSKSEKDQ
ncbi:peptidylprolyl isomerase [Phenylobacterium conjunctum]|uniref:SurA N-terminal domain-containing protein n=1 Tax=Phenylobacterium conjunctum TaxID=1298959 RepID=A0ABW3T061_9CAUL